MVGLHEHGIDAARRVHHLTRGMSEIGKNGEGRGAMPENESHRVGGIMRHGEGMDVEVSDLKGGSA